MDMLEQMDLLDISDQEALDVFLASTEEEDACSCPLEGSNGHLTTRNQQILFFYLISPGILHQEQSLTRQNVRFFFFFYHLIFDCIDSFKLTHDSLKLIQLP